MINVAQYLRRLASLAVAATALAATLSAQPSVLTWHNDNLRTGENLAETTLTPSNVNASTFGLLFKLTVDGKVDAQPLYVPGLTIAGGVHNVLYIATENDSVYAFDADTGTLLKQVSLLVGSETPSDGRGCGQVTPIIGITATPVIDPSSGPHGTIYVVAMSKDTSGNYHQRLHALDLTTLAEEFSGPVTIAATSSGSEEPTFLPARHKDRAALLLLNGIVYTSWSSHCDARPYNGWIIGYNKSNLQQTTVLNLTPGGNEGALWAAGSGPAADSSGNIYAPIANGTFDTTLTDGFPAKNDYGNAFVKLSTSGGLSVLDYFTMSNTVSESGSDTDLASGGGMLLPPLKDSQGNTRNLAVVAGKDSNIYVMDTANLGKFNSSTDAIYQQLSGVLSGGMWSSPAWFNGTLYYGPQGNVLKAFAFANGLFGTSPSSQTSVNFTFPGTTPSISANGTSNGIVWVYENSSPAVLHAYDAGNLANQLYNSNQAANGRDQFGNGNKFMVPTVVNGKVYVAANKSCSGNSCVGQVGVFGLLPAAPPPPTPPTAVSVSPNSGSGASQTFTFTFSDSSGASSIVSTQMDIGSTLAVAHSCFLYYAVGSNSLYLEDDTGVSHTPLTLASAGSAQNSQCAIDAGASSVTLSGNTLTVNLALSFLPAYAGAKKVYQLAQSASGNSGWAQLGAWTVTGSAAPPPPPPPTAPAAVSVSPNSGSGASQTFTFTFSDSSGASSITWTQMDIGSTLAVTQSCFFYYAVGSNLLYLEDDTGVSHTPLTLGSAGSAQNSQCAVDAGASSVTLSGNTLRVNLALSFQPAYAGAKNVYLFAHNASGNSGWEQLGAWTVTGSAPPPPPPGPPTAVSVSPNSGSGSAQTFTFTFSDSSGASNIASTQMDIGSTLAVTQSCFFYYAVGSNSLYLEDDTGVSHTPLTLGSAGTAQNSQCAINAAASSVTLSGNTLRVSLALSFQPAYAGAKNVYLFAHNASGNSGWAQLGAWTVP